MFKMKKRKINLIREERKLLKNTIGVIQFIETNSVKKYQFCKKERKVLLGRICEKIIVLFRDENYCYCS
jgi:hypothetical protein